MPIAPLFYNMQFLEIQRSFNNSFPSLITQTKDFIGSKRWVGVTCEVQTTANENNKKIRQTNNHNNSVAFCTIECVLLFLQLNVSCLNRIFV